MTRTMISVVCMLAFLLLPSSIYGEAPERFSVDKDRTVVLTPIDSKPIKLNQDRIILSTLTDNVQVKKRLTVTLQENSYKYTAESASGETPPDWIYYYELRSTSAADTFRWGIAKAGARLYGFRLFLDTDNTPYLAWMDGGSVCIADVSKQNSREAAVRAFFLPHQRFPYDLVPLFDLVNRDSFVDRNKIGDALKYDIDIVSVKKNRSKLMTVTVANYEGVQFTLVKTKGGWQVQ